MLPLPPQQKTQEFSWEIIIFNRHLTVYRQGGVCPAYKESDQSISTSLNSSAGGSATITRREHRQEGICIVYKG